MIQLQDFQSHVYKLQGERDCTLKYDEYMFEPGLLPCMTAGKLTKLSETQLKSYFETISKALRTESRIYQVISK